MKKAKRRRAQRRDGNIPAWLKVALVLAVIVGVAIWVGCQDWGTKDKNVESKPITPPTVAGGQDGGALRQRQSDSHGNSPRGDLGGHLPAPGGLGGRSRRDDLGRAEAGAE